MNIDTLSVGNTWIEGDWRWDFGPSERTYRPSENNFGPSGRAGRASGSNYRST